MEPMVLFGGMILTAGTIWTVRDLLEDWELLTAADRLQWKKRLTQAYSAFKSRDINSRTAFRAGLSQYKIS